MTAEASRQPASEGRDELTRWRCVVAGNRLDKQPPGKVLQAFWDARAAGDDRLADDLIWHLSDVVLGELRPKAKSYFVDGGRELVEEVHHTIMVAMLDATSADGKAMVEHFSERVHYRFIDAVKRHRRRHQVELPSLAGGIGDDGEADDPMAVIGFGSIEVAHALSLIKDERKRLAFALTMTNHPKGEIAAMLKIDSKTLYRWVLEVREFLKTELDL